MKSKVHTINFVRHSVEVGVFTKPHLKYYSGEGKYLLNNFIEVFK